MSMETDEAGKLRAFREKFGRGWDASRARDKDEETAEVEEGDSQGEDARQEDNLMDLISEYGAEAPARGEAKGVKEGKEKSGKGKGGER